MAEQPMDPEDAKLVTLARSALPRSVTSSRPAAGAAIRDETGRTYVACTVELTGWAISALQLAVAQAVSSGARRFEAAAVVTAAGAAPAPDELAVLSAVGGVANLVVADASGAVVQHGPV